MQRYPAQVVKSGERRGETLGALWAARCCEIGSCAAEIEIEIEIGTFPPALPADVPQLPPPPPSSPPGSLEAGESDEVSYWLMNPNPSPLPPTLALTLTPTLTLTL